MPDEFTCDVFLSHSAKNKAVVRPLAERLRADGVQAKAEFRIQKAELLHSSFSMLPSLGAFGSDWAQWESGIFRFRDELNKERRFIPLRLDDNADETLPLLTQQTRIVAEPGKETYWG